MKSKTARVPKKGERSVLLPGPTGAEPWELWSLSGQVECLGTHASPRDYRPAPATTLALPVAEVFCVPLWLNETDAKQFPGMITLQLEMRGLHPRSGVVFDWTVALQEKTRTLVVVGVLPAVLAAEVEAEHYDGFDLSARYLPLPEDAITLWQEQDRLVVAITRGHALVYFQALGEGQLSQRLLQDLNCLRATLMMQGVITSLTGGILLWYNANATEAATLKAALNLPVRQTMRPKPQLPSAHWKLVPSAVNANQKARESNRWNLRIGAIAFAVYLIVLAVLGIRYLWIAHQVADLRRWQADHAQALTLVHTTQAAWKELRPVVDRDGYPLEILLHVAQSIPHDQLHLTLFEVSDTRLLIKGEAKNVAAAFQFLDQLKHDPAFAGYNFEMPQPHILPNDLAQLQIDVTRPSLPAP